MKTIISNFSLLMFSVLMIVSCNDNSPIQKRSVTGKAGELIVVISKVSWESAPGDVLRKTIGQPQLSLPQEEPLFNLVNIPHEGFEKIFKSTRNIIITKISSTIEKPGVVFKNDVWASPQATVEIDAKDAAQFEKLVNDNEGKIISYFLQAEQNRLKSNFRRIHDKTILNTLKEKFDINMYCQPGFQIAANTDNFVWLKYETPEISQGIFVYTFDYVSDSTFTPDFLVQERDNFLKQFVPGPRTGSYMTTEKHIDPVFNILEYKKNYAAELRGLWMVQNDFMGGPYVMLAILDASKQRVLVADGYVYAPSKNKRNYLRQVEAMMNSIEFGDQAENDKINSQIKMGN